MSTEFDCALCGHITLLDDEVEPINHSCDPRGIQTLVELRTIADKMADAAQGVMDHSHVIPHEGYDTRLHRYELTAAIREYLKVRAR